MRFVLTSVCIDVYVCVLSHAALPYLNKHELFAKLFYLFIFNSTHTRTSHSTIFKFHIHTPKLTHADCDAVVPCSRDSARRKAVRTPPAPPRKGGWMKGMGGGEKGWVKVV